ncbi:glycoside hydrolase 5 family protein [Halorussus halophilus]|uniref:cellulase family glycosylhydrolase n=1 Tax=Halorussus halophilus TaxID=2650975 RepID=UPI0013018BBB|nr:cellulase family glycosylhydrolase [Halorussus halophilus]
MTRRWTRRKFLATGTTIGLASVGGCTAPIGQRNRQEVQGNQSGRTNGPQSPNGGSGTTAEEMAQKNLDPVDVRGALYVPARAWNTFQMWHDYDESIIERDLGYANQVELNAIRTWVSYEQWMEDQDALEQRIDHFLTAAEDRGIRVLFGLFESVGKEPTEDNLHATDPLTAPPVQSPASGVIQNEDKWDEPREYVRWFMDRYRDDDRVMAIEAMNEPGWLQNMKHFTEGMFQTMAEERGSVPLTVGSTSLANNADYVDWGSDVLQFHYNYPSDQQIYHDLLPDANQLGKDLDMPVWLTEWQRVANFGWGSSKTVDQWQPKYRSLAPVIHEHGVGNFFWSLMVKPAYVRYMRKRGIINGLFHEDGAVWHKEDAKAIKAMSGKSATVEMEERQQWPDWASKVKEHAFGN